MNPKNTFLPPFCFLAFSAAKLDTLLPKIKWKINMRQGSSFPQVSFNTSFFLKNTSKKLLRKVCSYVLLFFFYFWKCSQAYPISFKYTVGFLTSARVRCPVENTAYTTCSSSFSFYLALAYE